LLQQDPDQPRSASGITGIGRGKDLRLARKGFGLAGDYRAAQHRRGADADDADDADAGRGGRGGKKLSHRERRKQAKEERKLRGQMRLIELQQRTSSSRRDDSATHSASKRKRNDVDSDSDADDTNKPVLSKRQKTSTSTSISTTTTAVVTSKVKKQPTTKASSTSSIDTKQIMSKYSMPQSNFTKLLQEQNLIPYVDNQGQVIDFDDMEIARLSKKLKGSKHINDGLDGMLSKLATNPYTTADVDVDVDADTRD
jgi:hypothetical protein